MKTIGSTFPLSGLSVNCAHLPSSHARILAINFKYANAPTPFAGTCFLHANGGNYILISCYTKFIDNNKQHGIESMFQVQDP